MGILPFGKKIDELQALRLLASCVKTGNPERTLRTARDILQKRGQTKEASIIENIRYRIAEFGESLVNAFYNVGIIKEDRYHVLSLMEERAGLSPEPIENMVQVEEDLRRVKGEAKSALLLPVIIVFLSSLLGAFLIGQVWKVMESMKIEVPSALAFHEFIAKHFLIGGSLLAIISLALIIGIMSLIFSKSVSSHIKVFELAGAVSALRQQKVPYAEIFRFLSLNERSKKFRDLYSDISFSAESEDPADALFPLSELLPTEVASSFLTYLEADEEKRAWDILRNEMKSTAFNRLKAITSLSPLIAYFFVLGIILFSASPIGLVLVKLMEMQKATGGGF